MEKCSGTEWLNGGGRPGKEFDEKSMVSGCEVLFGAIGLSFMRFVVESLP